MEWLNLHTSVLDSPAVLGEEPLNRATWIFLLRYCIGQENNGRISGAVSWGDRKWQQLVRVTLAEVKAESSLWEWRGDDLVVSMYPVEKEREVKRKRAAARRNGNQGGRPKKTNVGYSEKPTLVNSPKAEGEGEGKDKGINTSEPAKPARVRDPLFDALAIADGSDPRQLTPTHAKRIGVALAQLRKACPSLTPAEIARRARIYASVMPSGTRCTASALAANWAKCGGDPLPSLASPTAPEAPPPEAWRTTMERLYPDNAVNREGRTWAEVPEAIKAEVRAASHQF